MKKILFAVAFVLFFVFGCGNNKQAKKNERKTPDVFQHVTVPSTLTNNEQRGEFVALHYWDNFDFTDTALISRPQVTEQGFADYVNLLPYFPADLYTKSIGMTLEKASVDSAMLDHFIGLFDKYLYDPNSPMRNEELYIPVLEWIIASDKVDTLNKLRPRHQLEMALKNRKGTKAPDFRYKLANGSTGSLHALKAEYTLIYFNNPGCHACAEVTRLLSESDVINDLIADGTLRILAIYPDKDLEEWRKEAGKMPKTWINAYDHNQVMNREKLYDIMAIPSLYLLDRNKIVVAKDATPALVIQILGGVRQSRGTK